MAITLEKALDRAYWRRKLWKRQKRWGSRRAAHRFNAVVERLGPGDLCIDLGANLGEYSARMAATGACVHGFEPDPYAFAQLRKRFADTPNVLLMNVAAGLEDGEVTLYRAPAFDSDPDTWSESSSIFADKTNIDPSFSFQVQQIDFLRYLDGLGRAISIVKMDIEGAEVPILERMFDSPAMSQIRWMFIETHEAKIPSLSRRTAALRRRAWFSRCPRLELGWH